MRLLITFLLLSLSGIAQTCADTVCQFTTKTFIAQDISNSQPFDTSAFTIQWNSTEATFNNPGNVNSFPLTFNTVGTFTVGYDELAPFCIASTSCLITVVAVSVSLAPSPICLFGQDESQPVDGASIGGGIYSIGGQEVSFLSLANIGQVLHYEVMLGNGCIATADYTLIGSFLHVPGIIISN